MAGNLNIPVGAIVEHTNSHRRGEVLDVKPWPDGTFEYLVQPDSALTMEDASEITSTWWSSKHVQEVQ